jgi:hypothetical protein
MASSAVEREVVLFSGAQPQWVDFSTSHRAELRKGVNRQDCAVEDLASGVVYNACYTMDPAGPYSPRHRHDFEQIRFVLDGNYVYGRGHYTSGWFGYFPEGVFYGPQALDEPGKMIVVQFQGPSRSPRYTREESKRAQKAMKEAGFKFEGGMCVRPDGKEQDGWEALYEFVSGEPLQYPAPRFENPIWINTENFSWKPSGIAGVSVKRLGCFNECGPAVQLIKLEAGASIPDGKTGAMMNRWVYEGEVSYAGRALPAETEETASDGLSSVSHIYYPPDTAYEGLSSARGALILSMEVQVGEGELPLPYRI